MEVDEDDFAAPLHHPVGGDGGVDSPREENGDAPGYTRGKSARSRETLHGVERFSGEDLQVDRERRVAQVHGRARPRLDRRADPLVHFRRREGKCFVRPLRRNAEGAEDMPRGLLRHGLLHPPDLRGNLEAQGVVRDSHDAAEPLRAGPVVVGGEGSMRGALALHTLGFPVLGIPASIDNDIGGTQMSLGVDTALNTIIEAIDKLRDTASSHQRAFIVETMGRECGYLALMAGIIGGAEVVLIPEQETPPEEVAAAISDAYMRGKTHAIIVVAEGATLHASELMKQLDAMNTGFQYRVTILGHIQRGGRPSAFDRLLASRFGVAAVERLLAGEKGVMVGLQGREIETTPLEEVCSKKRYANREYYRMAKTLAK